MLFSSETYLFAVGKGFHTSLQICHAYNEYTGA